MLCLLHVGVFCARIAHKTLIIFSCIANLKTLLGSSQSLQGYLMGTMHQLVLKKKVQIPLEMYMNECSSGIW